MGKQMDEWTKEWIKNLSILWNFNSYWVLCQELGYLRDEMSPLKAIFSLKMSHFSYKLSQYGP